MMALRRTLATLRVQLDEALSVVSELQVTVKDEPSNGSAVTDPFAYGADDMHGLLSEARATVDAVLRTEQQTSDLDRTSAAVGTCNELCLEVAEKLDGLLAFDRIAALRRYGRERNGPWRTWTASLQEALEACRAPLTTLERTLLEAWQEIADRAVTTSVSVQTTNVGQQLTVPAEYATEGST
jgi:hypothetical protein